MSTLGRVVLAAAVLILYFAYCSDDATDPADNTDTTVTCGPNNQPHNQVRRATISHLTQLIKPIPVNKDEGLWDQVVTGRVGAYYPGDGKVNISYLYYDGDRTRDLTWEGVYILLHETGHVLHHEGKLPDNIPDWGDTDDYTDEVIATEWAQWYIIHHVLSACPGVVEYHNNAYNDYVDAIDRTRYSLSRSEIAAAFIGWDGPELPTHNTDETRTDIPPIFTLPTNAAEHTTDNGYTYLSVETRPPTVITKVESYMDVLALSGKSYTDVVVLLPGENDSCAWVNIGPKPDECYHTDTVSCDWIMYITYTGYNEDAEVEVTACVNQYNAISHMVVVSTELPDVFSRSVSP